MMRAGRGRPFNRVATYRSNGSGRRRTRGSHTRHTKFTEEIPNFVQLYHVTHVTAPWPARSPATMTLLAGPRSGTVTLTLVSSTLSLSIPQERRFTDDDARPTASPRARTHVAPTHPASDAVSGRPLLWTRHTGTRRGGGAPSAAVPTAAVLTAAVLTAAVPTAAVPTAATAALSRCVPCSWYPKWYPSTWRQTAPRSQTPCTHRPHSRPERRRSSLST